MKRTKPILIICVILIFSCGCSVRKEKPLEVNENSLFIRGDGYISSFNTRTKDLNTIETPRFVEDFCLVNNKLILALFPPETPSKLSIVSLEGQELKTVDPPYPAPIRLLNDGKYIFLSFSYIDENGSMISVLDQDSTVSKEIAIPDLADKLCLDFSGQMVIKYFDPTTEDYCLGIIDDFIFTKIPLKSGDVVDFEIAPNEDLVIIVKHFRKYALEVLNMDSLEEKFQISLHSSPLGLAVGENRIYVLSNSGDSESIITEIDSETQAIEKETHVVYSEDLLLKNNKLYLVNPTEKSLTVIDVNSGETESILLGYAPYAIKEFE